MIRSLVKLALILVAGILIYNYFFGTSEEQDQSRLFFGKVRDVVVTGADLLKSEKHKFDAGKYDKLMDNLGTAYKAVRQRAQFVDQKVLRRLDELEARKAEIKTELDSIQEDEQSAPAPQKGLRQSAAEQALQTSKAADQQRRKEALQQKMEKLFQDSDILLQQAQQGQ